MEFGFVWPWRELVAPIREEGGEGRGGGGLKVIKRQTPLRIVVTRPVPPP